MVGVLGRVVSGTCQLAVLGGLLGALRYRRQMGTVATDPHSTKAALTTFSKSSVQGSNELYDVAIVGGGIVGVATAREIRARYPDKKVLLLEMEADVAQHQSGHNSGCIHAGMYYKPGTAMSRLCPRGHDLIIEYCKKYNLPMELCGKIIVATKESEVKAVETLYEYGTTNKVKGLELLRGKEAIQQKEPLVNGVLALYSPFTGIIDFAEVTRHMFAELRRSAKDRFTSVFQYEALDFVGVQDPTASEYVLIRGREKRQHGPEKTFLTRHVITCSGLSNDLVARHSGGVLERVGQRIVQTYCFRGQYYQLKPEKRDVVHMHVYPAPDPSKGIDVGVHFTPTVDVRRGRQVIIGPGSALAFDRYGYSPLLVDVGYCFNCAFSKGGWVSLMTNFNTFVKTYYLDISRHAFLREAQKLIPSIRNEDIETSFTGVMGMGVTESGRLSGDLAMEFSRPRVTLPVAIDASKKVTITPRDGTQAPSSQPTKPLILNVRNAPSPAATASMAIAEEIVANAADRFGWK